MLFRKKRGSLEKVHFSICYSNGGWEVYVRTDPSLPFIVSPTLLKPDVSIRYYPEQDNRLAEVAICHGDEKVVMKAFQSIHETRILIPPLEGYDQNKRHIVTLDHNHIYVALDGMGNCPFAGEPFYYNWSSEIITCTSKGQTVMELYPTFTPRSIGVMQIKGWINQSHVSYLPYLCGILGYVHLL